MSLELQALTAGQTGLTAYFVVYDATGRVWNGITFAVASAANRNAGAIAATELGTASGVYAADAPAFAAGVYSCVLYERAGGSPAESDALLAGPGELQWSGAAVVATPTAAGAAGAVWSYDFGSGRTAKKYLMGLVNKFTRTATTISMYDADDATPLYSIPITENAALNPITAGDPA